MGKNVAVFVDVANIFYAAKAAGVDIDYVTLLKAATAGRDFVRAYAYTGLDPDNENQRNFHSFLARHNYKVVSKDIRKYGDGKVKANLDIELVVDLMKTARNLDVAIIVSGDGDFAPAIRAVQEMGVRVEVISFRGNTSSDLMEVADSFADIAQVARVERGSSRSGRRVADDDEDLSMTEVPDKQTEGASGGRGRGRGRGRSEEPASGGAAGGRGRSRRVPTPTPEEADLEPIAAGSAPASIVALPGEKLSGRAAASSRPVATPEIVEDEEELEAVAGPDIDGQAEAVEGDAEGAAGGRRRRRRGGRGRGRGRGRTEDLEVPVQAAPALEIEEEEFEEVAAPRAPRPAAFGSIWDSQIGVPSAPRADVGPSADEDEEEPAIPEYLIAEQQRRGRGPVPAGRGPGPRDRRGGRAGAYASAIERERYGRPSGGGLTRFPDQAARGGGQGRAPARRDDRPPGPRPDRYERPPVQARSDQPWSEVPPELEELLRAQLAGKSAGRPAGGTGPSDRKGGGTASAAPPVEEVTPGEAPRPRRRGSRAGSTTAEAPVGVPVVDAAPVPAGSAEPAASRTPGTRARRPRVSSDVTTAATDAGVADAAPATTPRRRAARPPASSTAAAGADGGPATAEPVTKAPARSTARRKTASAASTSAGAAASETPPVDADGTQPGTAASGAAAPKRATRRRTTPTT